MPLYKKDIKKEITVKDVEEMLGKLFVPDHKIAVILLYLTGARPMELLELKKQDFIILENEVRIKIKTLKRGEDRTLIFGMQTPFLGQVIAYINKLENDEDFVFHFHSDGRLRQIVYSSSGNRFTPYTFRHNRHYKLAEMGANPYELMAWKGSKTMDSVAPYVIKSGQMIEKYKNKIK